MDADRLPPQKLSQAHQENKELMHVVSFGCFCYSWSWPSRWWTIIILALSVPHFRWELPL